MSLTAEEQEEVVQLLMAHPHRRDEILEAAGKMSRSNESMFGG